MATQKGTRISLSESIDAQVKALQSMGLQKGLIIKVIEEFVDDHLQSAGGVAYLVQDRLFGKTEEVEAEPDKETGEEVVNF